MRLAVLGGTGLAGSAVVEQAAERGHHVRALVRGSTSPPRALLEADIVRGDDVGPDAVARTISGADTVVSSLGGYGGPASITAGTEHIITAMRRNGSDRLVVLQGFHIDFPGDPRNPGKHLVKAFLALRCRPLLEHGAALGGCSEGPTTWLDPRADPPDVSGPASGRARMGTFALGSWSSVRVGDAASTLLDLVVTAAFVREAPMLFTPRRRSPGSAAGAQPTTTKTSA
jgi:NAD(P)H-binding